MIDREPEECVAARVTSTGTAYLVTLVRADRQSVPILCHDAQGATDLLDRMNPAQTEVCIPAHNPAWKALFGGPHGEAEAALKAAISDVLAL